MRPPRDLDELMWELAEGQNTLAIDQFCVRYPEYAPELRKRASMVKGLKRAKVVEAPKPAQTPKFVPRAAPPKPSSWAVGWTAGLVLAAVGAIAFAVAMFAFPNQNPQVKKVEPTQVVQSFPPEPVPEVTPPSPTSQNDPKLSTQPRPEDLPPVTEPVLDYLKPTSVSLKGAKLTDAVRMVAAQGNLGVVVAPGFPEISVDINYEQMSPIEILQAMGRDYAFTAFDQGDGTVIVVPAVEPTLREPVSAEKIR